MAASQAEPSHTINLQPDLGLVVSLLHGTGVGRLAQQALSAQDLDAQAVATAVTISKGTTFTVLKKKTAPKFLPKWQPTAQARGATVVAGRQPLYSEVPPREILYKVPNVELDEEGRAVPEKRAQLAGLLVEALVLLHQPIDQHPFIPRLWGLTWTYNSYSQSDRIPVLVMHVANHGSLAEFQASRTEPLGIDEKRKVCWQVGVAMDFLHQCGIKHGDIKSENVLIYDHPDGGFLAKLTDFGFASISDYGSFNFLPPGSTLWASPEVRWKSDAKIDLKQSDAYAYGLLAWRIFCDGGDPLSKRILLDAEKSSETDDRPDDPQLLALMRVDTVLARAEKLVGIKIMDDSKQVSDSSLPWLSKVFQATLLFDPQQRNINEAIAQFNFDNTFHLPEGYPNPSPIQDAVNSHFQSAAKNSTSLSWIAMRRLDPFTRDALFRHGVARLAREDPATTDKASLFLGNTASRLSGMGTDAYDNVDDALKTLATACRRANRSAAALIFRLHDAFQRDVPGDIDVVERVKLAAIFGSDSAYEDLRLIGSELCQQIKFSKQHQTCGVGASFFWDEHCLHGWSFADYKTNLGWILRTLESSRPESWKIKVNKRGDSFLHAAVSLSIEGLLQVLLDKYKFPIDLENDAGETPLLCAMRSGRADFVHELLDRGAKADHVSKRGETPMHWLISFADIGVQSLANKLIQHGAAPSLKVWAERCDYAGAGLPSYFQYAERLSLGNPLHWAVCRKKPYHIRTLMDYGGKVDDNGPDTGNYTPLEQAAYLQEADLLRLMAEKQFPLPRKHHASHIGNRAAISLQVAGEETHTIFHGLREMVKAAIDGSDRYSLLVRHGERYKSMMRRTFRILGEETKLASFPEGIDQEAHTILHYAAMHGYEEAVSLVVTYMNGAADINVRHGYLGDTPICEAIRRNHKSMYYLLLSKGADVSIPVDDPTLQGLFYWGLLHIAAQFVVGNDLQIATHLIANRVKLDGYGTMTDPAESPLAIALDTNQLAFSTLARRAGANINATSKYVLQGRYRLKYHMTILGRSIVANMRHSHYKLKYLLYPSPEVQKLPQPSFVVIPVLGITALHASLLAEELLQDSFERDVETANDIFSFLCERFDSSEEINQQTHASKETALHIAVRKGNMHAVQTLINDYDAAADISNVDGLTAQDIAELKLSTLVERGASEDEIERFVRIAELVGPSPTDTDELNHSVELLERMYYSNSDTPNPEWINPVKNEILAVQFDLMNQRLQLTSLRQKRTTSMRVDVSSPLPFPLQRLPPLELRGQGFIAHTVIGPAMLLVPPENAISDFGDRRSKLMWSIMETIQKKIDPPPPKKTRFYWTVTNTNPKEDTFEWGRFMTMTRNFLSLIQQNLSSSNNGGQSMSDAPALDLRDSSSTNAASPTLHVPKGITEAAPRIEWANRWLVCLKFDANLFGSDKLMWFFLPFEAKETEGSVPVDRSVDT